MEGIEAVGIFIPDGDYDYYQERTIKDSIKINDQLKTIAYNTVLRGLKVGHRNASHTRDVYLDTKADKDLLTLYPITHKLIGNEGRKALNIGESALLRFSNGNQLVNRMTNIKKEFDELVSRWGKGRLEVNGRKTQYLDSCPAIIERFYC